MNPRIGTLGVIILSGMLLVIAWQWQTTRRLRDENQQLQTAKQQDEESLAQAERRAETSAKRAAEAQDSVEEVVSLRAEVQKLRQDLERPRLAPARRALGSPPMQAGPETGPLPPKAAFAQSHYSGPMPTFAHMSPDGFAKLSAQALEGTPYSSGGGQIDGLRLCNTLSKEATLSGPDWDPSQPLPLSFTSVEDIARAELRKLVKDEPMWAVEGISLARWNDHPQKWNYLIHLRDASGTDYLMVNVTMGGSAGTTIISDNAP
jgi:hypothetical protein